MQGTSFHKSCPVEIGIIIYHVARDNLRYIRTHRKKKTTGNAENYNEAKANNNNNKAQGLKINSEQSPLHWTNTARKAVRDVLTKLSSEELFLCEVRFQNIRKLSFARNGQETSMTLMILTSANT